MNTARAILEFFDVPVSASWTMAPADALQFMRAKGLRTTFDWRDMVGEEHSRAFTVAKMMDVDLLADVKASLEDAIARGVPFKEWSDTITPTLQAKGWWGRKRVVDPLTGREVVAQLGSPARLATIYRTNMQAAYMAGQWQTILEQAEEAPYLLYDAVDDGRTRDEHAAWDGVLLPIVSTWWKTHYPPNGWNCRCGTIQLTLEEAAELGITPASAAPADGSYTWTNPRTGERQRIPKGIDPGWAHNVGESRAKALREVVADKLQGYDRTLAAAAVKGFRAALEAGKRAAAAAPNSATAASLGQMARATTRGAERVAQASIDAALEAGGTLAAAIRALLRTKAGKAMTAVALLEAATARVEADRALGRQDLDGF